MAHPDLPHLLELYGFSINTVWTEPQYHIWRERPDDKPVEGSASDEHVPGKGAAIGFLVSQGYAIIWGNPLCPVNDYRPIVDRFTAWLTKHKLIPVWCCIDEALEKILASEPYDWTGLSCVKEDVVDPTVSHDMSTLDKRVRNKIYKAQRKNLVIWEDSYHLPEKKWQDQADEGMRAWEKNRKGMQIHVTDLQPWRDAEHRRYFYGRAPPEEGGEERVVGMVVLAKVHDGYVVKWALEFPGAPKGTSESIIMFVMDVLHKEDQHSLTFGASGGNELKAVDNIKGWKFQTLSKTYGAIAATFHLANKGEYREKFNAHTTRLFISYPKDKLGMKGIDAITSVLQQNTYSALGEGEGGHRLQTPAVERPNPLRQMSSITPNA